MTRRAWEPHRCAGFTLLEVLASVALFAIVAAAALAGLAAVLAQYERLVVAGRDLDRLQKTVALMRSDLQQAVGRPVRDELGTSRAAMLGGGDTLLELTRGGWSSAAGANAGGLRRVAYVMERGELIRLVWDALDRTPGDTPRRQRLLENVAAASSRFHDTRGWVGHWPAATASASSRELPRGVELAFSTTNGASYRFLFIVGG